MGELKALHLCKNIDELESYSGVPDTRHMKIDMLVQSARKIFHHAENQYSNGDEEMAYIYYNRYFNMLSRIHRRPEYQNKKSLIREALGDNRKHKMSMDRLEVITKSLTERYKTLNKSSTLEENVIEDNESGIKSPLDTSKTNSSNGKKQQKNARTNGHRSRSSSPIIPTMEQQNIKYKLNVFTHEQLFECIRLQNVLIMDCRPSADYEASHLNYSVLLNVPEEHIKAGMSAGRIQDRLDKESRKWWSARAIKEHVVLMDWDCTDDEPDERLPISILKNILELWDPDVNYRSPIKILKGGYEYFITMYPTFCTNPTVQAPKTIKNSLIYNQTSTDIIDHIEYPSIDQIMFKDELLVCKNNRKWNSKYSTATTSTKMVTELNNDNENGNELNETSERNNLLQSKMKPPINRDSKEAALKIYNVTPKTIAELAKDQEIFMQKAKENDRRLELIAKQWENIRNKEQLTTDDENFISNMIQWDSESIDNKNENMRLKEELAYYKELIAKAEMSENGAFYNNNNRNHLMETNIPNNDHSKVLELEETIRKLRARINERELIDERLDRERQQRAQQLAIIRKMKPIQATTTNGVSNSPETPSLNLSTLSGTVQHKNNHINNSNINGESSQNFINNHNNNNNKSDNIESINNKENMTLKASTKSEMNNTHPSLPRFDRSIKPVYQSGEQSPQQTQQMPQLNVFSSSTSLANFISRGTINEDVLKAVRRRNFSPLRGKNGRGLTGLKNLGNTCYMNSIIQCLSNTTQLAEYCVTDKYKDYINRNNQTKGQIVEELAALIKILWTRDLKSVSCRNLRYVMGQYQKMFRNTEQQDSHEFLTILIDWLHSDLKTLNGPDYAPQTGESDMMWSEFTKYNQSLILSLFYGQMKSVVKCSTCKHESNKFECFTNLSLELPANQNVCELTECLNSYFGHEYVYGWCCPRCKDKNKAIKSLLISQLPSVLVVHLKRFHADADKENPQCRKKQNTVKFPLEDLDMGNYLSRSLREKNLPKTYQLYAVSNHYGSMESGHCTAFCKVVSYGRWYKFDDQLVTLLNASNVVTSAAYILFYTRLPIMQIPEIP